MAPHLASLKSLQLLALGNNGIRADGASALGAHLARLTASQCRKLGRNSIGREGAPALVPHLTGPKSL